MAGAPMSGYASRAEVVEVIRQTIISDHNSTGLSRDPADYNLSALVRENFHQRGPGYGWGTSTGAEEFIASLRRNLRRNRPAQEAQQ
jgi:hypothetical protein